MKNKYSPRSVTPKAQRDTPRIGPARPLADPVRVLGHAARPRKRRGR